MKFANKLFFAVTAILTFIFTVFGIWLLSFCFQKVLEREIVQSNTESRMFQYLFELTYQSMEEYGDDYAIDRAIDSIMDSVEREENHCFVQNEEGKFLYGEKLEKEADFAEAIAQMKGKLSQENNYVYGIRKMENEYYVVNVIASETQKQTIYLGMCKNISVIYEDRQSLLNQYRIALGILLFIGGISVYILSQYITKPIRNLSKVAGYIASGDYEKRSDYSSLDEIGNLSQAFNDMADRLMEQMNQLELAAEQKALEAKQQEDFTAAFAHELKTPLTSIIGYADMLNTIPLSEKERQEAYFYIYSQGKRLESLSHKLLELVSMDRQPVLKKEVSAKYLEENLRAAIRPIFRKKKIKWKITMEKGSIYGDGELLLSLFYNLLDNSFKAVEEDGFILLKGVYIENGYQVKVIDNGCGIPRQEIERITEAFYMVDKSRSRKEGGAGIGMSLCKKIIELHNGSMQIESQLGEGTVVLIQFNQIK